MKLGVLFLFFFYIATAFGCLEKISPVTALENNLSTLMHSRKYINYMKKKMAAFIADPYKKGYTIFDTEKLFPKKIIKRVFKDFPFPCDIILQGKNYIRDTTCPENSSTKAIRNILNTYTDWITDIFNQLSPKEKIFINSSELRFITPKKGSIDPEWHTDGGYLALGLPLLGRGTEYLEDSPIIKNFREVKSFIENIPDSEITIKTVETGSTMLFNAIGRFRGYPQIPTTVHRSPQTQGKRIFLIVRYYKK